MFYCDPCASKKHWPITLSRSNGKCEVCGEVRVCNDKASRLLPIPKEGE